MDNNDKYLLVVPNHKRRELISSYHKELAHIGIQKVNEIMKRKYYWPNMSFYIKVELAACTECLYTKENNYGVTPLQSTITSFPFQRFAIDIAGPLQISNLGHQ